MSTADSESRGPIRVPPEVGGPSRLRRWLWLGVVAITLSVAAFTVVSGLANRILTVVAVVLFLDMVSGSLFITFFVFLRILLPLAITIALIPFCLIWPGESDAPHWSTVRARFQSLGRMWRGHWGLDRG